MIARLLLANALELATGVGLAAAVGMPLWCSYLLGLAVVGIVSAHLALVHVSFGWAGLAILAVAALAFAFIRGARPVLPRTIRIAPISGVGAVVLAAMFARAWPTFASKPLDNYDAWAMWGMKAKALVDFGWADPSLFASRGATELHLDYPLLVPSLEAVAARAMGGYDERLIHLQFLLFGAAGVTALAGLLRPRVRPEILWPMLVAVAFAPAFLGQLVTAYADIPLGIFVAVGVAAAARWVDENDASLLVTAAVCFAAAALTKNEGTLFVVCALLALLLATRRLRPVLISAAAVECALLPWQIWLATHHIHSDTATFLHIVGRQPAGVGPTVLHGLLDRLLSIHAWPMLVPIFVVAVLAAAGTRLAVFAWSWFLFALLALTAVYVASSAPYSEYLSSSGDRVIDAVVIGCAALVPLLAQEVSEGLTTITSR